MFWTLAMLGAAVLLLFASASLVLPLVASGFSAEKLALTRSLFYLLLQVLVFSGCATIWSTILNAGQTFALPALVPVATPLVTIAAILAVGKAWGIYAVAGATLCGAVLELGFLGWKLKQRGYCLWPRRHSFDANALEVFGQYVSMVAGALLMSSTAIVNQSIAAILGSGGVAALNYGNKLVSLIVSIGALVIGTAVLPHFSWMVAAGDWGNVCTPWMQACQRAAMGYRGRHFMTEPKIAQKSPLVQPANAGTHYWCTCGASKGQPFCDGAHKGTGFAPLKFDLPVAKTVAWCGCKHTKVPPFCDGSHARL